MNIDDLVFDGRRCGAMLAAGARRFLEMRSDSALWTGDLRAPQVASLVRSCLRSGVCERF